MPSLDAPPMRTRPANCADIIVSILYRHDPKTLREFFGKEHFVYAHFSTDPEDRRGPFVIVRARQRVEVCDALLFTGREDTKSFQKHNS